MGRDRVTACARASTLAIRQPKLLPQTLVFFVTARCNARCDFCLYKESVANPTLRSDELTVDEVIRIARTYGPLNFLAVSGGEPFVRRDLGELCQAFVDECGTSVIDIPSNFAYGDTMVDTIGTLVADNPNVIVELQLSIDHLGKRHDASRGVTGLFDSAIANFRRMTEIRRRHPNLSLKVNIVWLERNKSDLDAIVDGLTQLIEFDRIHVGYPNLRMPTVGRPDLIADFDEFSRASDRVATRARSRLDPFSLPMRGAKVSSNRVVGDAIRGDRNLGAGCEAGRHVLVLDERGTVYPCEVIWEPIGNVRDHDYRVDRVLEGDAYERFRDRNLGEGRCNCTWSCAALAEVSVTPRRLPRLAWDTIRVATGTVGRG